MSNEHWGLEEEKRMCQRGAGAGRHLSLPPTPGPEPHAAFRGAWRWQGWKAVNEPRLRARFLALPLSVRVTSWRSLGSSEPCCPHLQHAENDVPVSWAWGQTRTRCVSGAGRCGWVGQSDPLGACRCPFPGWACLLRGQGEHLLKVLRQRV